MTTAGYAVPGGGTAGCPAGSFRLCSLATAAGSTALQQFTYGYDAAGNLTSLVNPLEQNQTYGYDGLDRLTSWTLGAQTETYVYDELGNWLGVNSPTATYPPSGPGSVRPHALQSWAGRTYSYDANGNVTGVTGDLTRSLTYDVENRPVSITTNGTPTTLAYGGDGRRVQKTSGTLTTTYVDRYYECENGLCVKWIWAGDRRIAMKQVSTGAVSYLHADQLGSLHVVTSSTGAVEQTLSYAPWGGPRIRTGPTDVPYKFTDQELDDETGLYHYKARSYDFANTRFIQPDTLVPDVYNPQSWNRYSHVRNNPVNFVDPTGHFTVPEHMLITYKAMRDSGWDVKSAYDLAWKTGMVDKNTQGISPDQTRFHFMTGMIDGKPDTQQHAFQNAIELQVDAIWNGDLEYAMHPAQDAAARAHALQVWNPQSLGEVATHIWTDMTETPSEVEQAKHNSHVVLQASQMVQDGDLRDKEELKGYLLTFEQLPYPGAGGTTDVGSGSGKGAGYRDPGSGIPNTPLQGGFLKSLTEMVPYWWQQ